MILVAVLVKTEQHVRLVARAQNFAAADADLENGRPAGNRRGNRHERHDLLFAAAREPCEKSANGLDAVLRIARNADYGFVDLPNFLRATRRRRFCNCITHGTSKLKIYRAQRGAADGSGQHDNIACFTLTGGAIMSNSNDCFVAIRGLHPSARKMNVVYCCASTLRC